MSGETGAKARLAGWLGRRFFVRWHFSLILAVSFGVGLLTTKSFLALGMETLHWRWPIALLAAYLAFLLCVRLWLGYVGLGRYLGNGKDDRLEIPDLNFSGGGGSSGGSGIVEPSLPRIGGGGGQFGGGGASGDFGVAAETGGGDSLLSAPAKAVGEAVGGADEGCLVVLVILALLAVIFGVGGYLVWQAPALLAEVAFEAALAAGLVKPLRRIDDPGWLGGALRASWLPFLIIFLCAMAIAGLAGRYAPEATTLPEAIRILLQ